MDFVMPSKQQKPDYVRSMFNNIAKHYDKLNDYMSFGFHRSCKKKAIALANIKPNSVILDLCTGTGDLALMIAKNHGFGVEIIGLDFSEKMLDIAKNRAYEYPNIKFEQGDALNIPYPADHFDHVFIGFGLRNLNDIGFGIKEMFRVVKKDGGTVVNLDFGRPDKALWYKMSDFYLQNIVPLMGQAIHGNATPYKYLGKSIDLFTHQNDLVKLMLHFGAKRCVNQNILGGSIAIQVCDL